MVEIEVMPQNDTAVQSTSSPKSNDRSPESQQVVKIVRTVLKLVKDCFNWSSAPNSSVHSWIWLNFDLIRNFIVVLVTCKNEEDPIKNRGDRVLTTLYIEFSDVQRQVTPQSVVGSG